MWQRAKWIPMEKVNQNLGSSGPDEGDLRTRPRGLVNKIKEFSPQQQWKVTEGL